ncbi:MAG: methyltransferase [Candidatus Omnitrophota bacterium]
MKKRIKVNGFLIFAAVMLVIIFPRVFLREYCVVLAEKLTRIFGVFLVLSGQLLRVSARGYKAENSGSGSQLIQYGPYSLSRNPMYLGILLIGLGLGLALFKYWVILVFLVIFFARYALLAFAEEKKLLGVFGNTYADYCRRVPRFFPRMKLLFEKDIRVVLPLKQPWLYKEIGAIVATLLAAAFFILWEGMRR